MKIGDIVHFSKKRIGGPSKMYGLFGVVVSELIRFSSGPSYVEILVNNEVVSVNWKDVEVIK